MYPLKEKIIPTEVALVLHGILMSSVNLVLFESTDQLNEPFFGFVGGEFCHPFSPWVKCIWFSINLKLSFKSSLGYLVNLGYTSYT